MPLPGSQFSVGQVQELLHALDVMGQLDLLSGGQHGDPPNAAEVEAIGVGRNATALTC